MKKFSTICLLVLLGFTQYNRTLSYLTCKLENLQASTCDCEKILEEVNYNDGLPESPAATHQHKISVEEYLVVEKNLPNTPQLELYSTRPAACTINFHLQTVYDSIFRPPCIA